MKGDFKKGGNLVFLSLEAIRIYQEVKDAIRELDKYTVAPIDNPLGLLVVSSDRISMMIKYVSQHGAGISFT